MLTNKSKHTCTVRGYVGLGYVDTKNKHHSSTANRSKKIKVTTITLKPGHTAFAGANFISQPTGCAKATKALVTPPNQTKSLVTPFLSAQGSGKTQTITLCGNKFNATALSPIASAIGIFA
jgi:ABC-type phosphate transport system substrate-binding protein